MNILELDSYDLGDAVKFNDQLNPKLWDASEHLKPEVKAQLLMIAEDFREFLGVTDLDLQDITISGSNAAYTYTPNSDIDLHLVVKMPNDPIYRELFDAKKFQYNEQHNIKIGGYDVELYVQDADQPHISQGIYSILSDDWIQVPRRVKSVVDDTSTENKFKTIGLQIERAIKSGSLKRMTRMAEKIKKMRQTGLEQHGEFGPENLAFKMLRTQGKIKELYDARNAAKDQELSLDERRKSKKKKRVKYGFGGYWYPGTAYAGQDHPAGTEGGDGGGDGGGESIRESVETSDEDILRDFVNFCVKELKIEQMPRVKLRKDPQWSAVHKTFGRYNDDAKTLEVSWGQRHIMDVLRTVAHELTHKHQHEREGERMGPNAGETGSPYENEANARAGVLMRDYGRLHPEYFAQGQSDNLQDVEEGMREKLGALATAACIAGTPGCSSTGQILKTTQDVGRTAQTISKMTRAGVQDEMSQELRNFIRAQGGDPNAQNLSTLYRWQKRMEQSQPAPRQNESASGYIPTKKQAKDPRFSMALTVDVKPGQVGKEANKLKLKTNKQGQPQVANPNGLFEDLMLEYQQFNEKKLFALAGEDYSPDDPPGPEFKPTMPKGTLRVDVSDVYDWYKLGQHISNMKGLGQHDFGQGPPGAIISFGDEDTEHKFIDDLKATGLDVTDIDPVDPVKRPGKKIKTDPTYNVDEAIQAPVSKQDRATQDYYKFIVGKIKLGRVLNRQEQEFLKMYNLKQQVAEYAVTPDRDDDTQGPDYIEQLANRWWNAADPVKQERIAAVLRTFGYAISQVESEDDAVQLTDIKSGHTYFISADDFDPDLFESVELDEVNMSPGALEKFAASKEAQGIRAGFEAELIFRDTQGDDEDDYDMEPDYDMDERAYSIQQVIEFFSNDDWGYGLSDRQIRSLENELDEQYMNWRDERMTEDFKNEAEDLVRKVIEDEEWDWDDAVRNQLDDMGLSNDEIEETMRVGRTAGRFNSSKEQEAYAKENPGYQRYLEAYSAAESILDDLVEESVKEQDKYYDAALDDFRDNYSGDDDSFFSDVGMRWMSDVGNNFGLDWPYMTGGGNSNNGSRSWDEIGNELQAVVGMPVKVSSNYHSTTRKEGQWIIEPDGSLDPDDKSEEVGLEIVSPPMPLLMTLEKLKAVTDWANDPNGGNAYTNSSTGLHMGVSIPFVGGDVDYVKLIMFMGDKYVLEQFGRASNTYAASAMDKLRQNLAGGRSDPAGVATLLKNNLAELAFKELQKGVGTSKYTSAHIQNGYIEFRSPGGDWLAKSDEDIGILENTMMRFAQAMYIASRADLERNEYAKKLYKLISEYSGDSDHLKLFAEFNAGIINKEQLKKQWAEKTIGTEKKMNQRWKLYQKVNDVWTAVPGGEWNGYTEDQVKTAVWSKYGREALDSGEYQLVNTSESQEWEVYDVKTGKTLEIVKGRNKGEVADAVFDKYVDQGIGFQVRPHVDPKTLTPRAKLAKRIVEPKKQPTPSEQQARNERDVPYWEIYEKETGHVVHTFLSDDLPDAVTDAYNWLVGIGAEQPRLFAVRAKMVPTPQAADSRKDSADLQRTLGVQDVEPDIAQNFSQPQDATQRSGSWSIYDVTLGREISRMNDVPWQQANDRADELERSTGHNMSVRGLSETIDPISGSGAVPPRPIVKKINKDKFEPVEPVAKSQSYRSAIGQAISKKDLEDMTQQIKMARKLGDSVMEMEDTPPEVIQALNQAAQKNGYKNWADVKANPRSTSAVMTVAKLANTILKTTGTHHPEKIFYKNKLDK
jgi:hypothetical protein